MFTAMCELKATFAILIDALENPPSDLGLLKECVEEQTALISRLSNEIVATSIVIANDSEMDKQDAPFCAERGEEGLSVW